MIKNRSINLSQYKCCKVIGTSASHLKGPAEKGQQPFRTQREKGKTAHRGQQSSGEPVMWMSECQEALEQLITAITNPPVMVYPYYSEPFIGIQ